MKILKGIINVVTTLIIIVGIIFIALYTAKIVPYVVLSGSMEPTIKTGSLSFINKNAKYEEIKEKDIIAFKLNDGTLVTHRVESILDDGIQTKGDANEKADTSLVTKDHFVGKNIFSIPKVGKVVKLLQSTRGKIVFGVIILLLLVAGFLLGDSKDNSKDYLLNLDNKI